MNTNTSSVYLSIYLSIISNKIPAAGAEYCSRSWEIQANYHMFCFHFCCFQCCTQLYLCFATRSVWRETCTEGEAMWTHILHRVQIKLNKNPERTKRHQSSGKHGAKQGGAHLFTHDGLTDTTGDTQTSVHGLVSNTQVEKKTTPKH